MQDIRGGVPRRKSSGGAKFFFMRWLIIDSINTYNKKCYFHRTKISAKIVYVCWSKFRPNK